MPLHVHTQSDEGDAFALQKESLLRAFYSRQQDLAGGAYDPLPGEYATRTVQRPHHLPRRAGKTGGVGDVAVGRDLAAREFCGSSHGCG